MHWARIQRGPEVACPEAGSAGAEALALAGRPDRARASRTLAPARARPHHRCARRGRGTRGRCPRCSDERTRALRQWAGLPGELSTGEKDLVELEDRAGRPATEEMIPGAPWHHCVRAPCEAVEDAACGHGRVREPVLDDGGGDHGARRRPDDLVADRIAVRRSSPRSIDARVPRKAVCRSQVACRSPLDQLRPEAALRGRRPPSQAASSASALSRQASAHRSSPVRAHSSSAASIVPRSTPEQVMRRVVGVRASRRRGEPRARAGSGERSSATRWTPTSPLQIPGSARPGGGSASRTPAWRREAAAGRSIVVVATPRASPEPVERPQRPSGTKVDAVRDGGPVVVLVAAVERCGAANGRRGRRQRPRRRPHDARRRRRSPRPTTEVDEGLVAGRIVEHESHFATRCASASHSVVRTATSGKMADMRFRKDARLDPSQVEDYRGARAGGARPGGVPSRWGRRAIGVIVLVAFLLLSGGGGGIGDLGALSGQTVGPGTQATDLQTDCRTGETRTRGTTAVIVAVVNSVQAYWAKAVRNYQPARTRFFTNSIQTGCGTATSAVGPFYCPQDRYVYIDLGFFDDLRSQLGARGGALAEAYVLAHEYGHHVQNLTGTLRSANRDTGRRAARFASSSRRTATRGLGRPCARHGLCRGHHPPGRRGRPRRGCGRRRRPDPGARYRARDTRVLDARLVRAAAGMVYPRRRGLRPAELRHLQRTRLAVRSHRLVPATWVFGRRRRRGTGRLKPHPRGYVVAAMSVNFAYRLRKLSLIASVGPLRCFARITSASPCESDSSPL